MTVQVDYHYYLLDEEEDGWYNAGAALVATRPAGGFTSNDDDLAQEVDLTINYQLYKNVGILAGYSFFKAEDWIEDNIADFDTSWGYLQTTVTF